MSQMPSLATAASIHKPVHEYSISVGEVNMCYIGAAFRGIMSQTPSLATAASVHKAVHEYSTSTGEVNLWHTGTTIRGQILSLACFRPVHEAVDEYQTVAEVYLQYTGTGFRGSRAQIPSLALFTKLYTNTRLQLGKLNL